MCCELYQDSPQIRLPGRRLLLAAFSTSPTATAAHRLKSPLKPTKEQHQQLEFLMFLSWVLIHYTLLRNF